ncbi:UNVERIFIED_CONTAM: hypothetical protein K2H54_009135 [Gekko kuhli]
MEEKEKDCQYRERPLFWDQDSRFPRRSQRKGKGHLPLILTQLSAFIMEGREPPAMREQGEGEAEQELGPPPSVDEAANTLMTRLGFLLGDKVAEVQAGQQYSMEGHEDNQQE